MSSAAAGLWRGPLGRTLAAVTPYLLAAAASYLSGSVPWALLVTRWRAGVDLRTVGSGNPGATNASRVLGKGWGFAILLLDAAKGAVPVAVLPHLFADSPRGVGFFAVTCALAAVLGHVFPVWLRFRGGKGVATGLGVAVVLHPLGTLAGVAAFLLVAVPTRLVALASTAAAWAFAAACLFLPRDHRSEGGWHAGLAAFAVGIAVLITARHAGNFARMARGEESKWGGADLKPAPPDVADGGGPLS